MSYFNLLHCNINLRINGHSLNRMKRFIVQDADHNFPIYDSFDYDVDEQNNQCIVSENGKVIIESDIDHTAFTLLRRIHSHVFSYNHNYISMHAGCASYNSKNIIFAGQKNAGKTTLMIKLLYEGFQVEGDELVLIDQEKIFAFPRNFHIKSGTFDLIPQLQSNRGEMAWVQRNNQRVYAFSPLRAGFQWEITPKPIDMIVYLEHHEQKTSFCKPCAKYEMVKRLMPLTYLSETKDYLKIEQLCNLINQCKCYLLNVGSLDMATVLIQNLAL